MATFQSLPGFREFYPDALSRRNHLFRVWRRVAHGYGFAEYDAPVLEPLELYTTKSGEEIEQQLFSFVDKGDRSVALRPEMTPTVCRMVGAKAASMKRPIKWFSIAEFYRYERAQKGRERAFFQFNADLFGEPGPEAEIELIGLLVHCLTGLGLTEDDFYVRLSDRNLWFFYLEALGFTAEQARSILGAIDKYEKIGDAAFAGYAERFGTLDDERKARILAFLEIKSLPALETTLGSLVEQHPALAARLGDWRKLLGGLTAMGMERFVAVDLGVVRGLAYYTGFVFEAFDRKGEFRALAGGGRYDDLVKKLGGPDLPAVGFAIGDVTMGLLLESRGLMPAYVSAPDVVCVIGAGAAERAAALRDVAVLREAGFRVDYPLKDAGFGKQFKAAAESGAKLALIYGESEVALGLVKIRDLAARQEQDVPAAQVAETVREFLHAG